MKLLSTVIILSMFLLFSCNETKSITKTTEKVAETTENVSAQKSLKATSMELVGTWEWVKTDCCGRMNKTTMAKENDPKRIISFNKNGTARYFMKGDKSKMGEYKYSLNVLGSQPTVQIGEYRAAIFAIKGDQLVLSWGYMDLQTETYKRVKY